MEHEYIKHYVAGAIKNILFYFNCYIIIIIIIAILVVSSRQTRPIEVFQNLYKNQKEAEKQQTYPYWLPSPHLYYYHILVHDVIDGNWKQ